MVFFSIGCIESISRPIKSQPPIGWRPEMTSSTANSTSIANGASPIVSFREREKRISTKAIERGRVYRSPIGWRAEMTSQMDRNRSPTQMRSKEFVEMHRTPWIIFMEIFPDYDLSNESVPSLQATLWVTYFG